MKNWSSTQFLQEKKQELIEAALQTHRGFVTARELSEFVSLGNGMKECFLKAGILIKGAKLGKAQLFKIDIFNCNEENIRLAYSFKAQQKDNKVHSAKIDKVREVAEREGLTSTTNTIKTKKQNIFPSIDDCLSFLRHHYGMNHEVILVPEGFKLEGYSVKALEK